MYYLNNQNENNINIKIEEVNKNIIKSNQEIIKSNKEIMKSNEEVKEEIISKKSNDREITEKSKISSKVISRNVTALKKQAEKEGISINDLIKMLKSE